MTGADDPTRLPVDHRLLPPPQEGFDFRFGAGWGPSTPDRTAPPAGFPDAPTLDELLTIRHRKITSRK